jgi:hypothetical protein
MVGRTLGNWIEAKRKVEGFGLLQVEIAEEQPTTAPNFGLRGSEKPEPSG